ncbi:MAG: class I SAM-dependent RNA methyltransferase, partial [Desulfobacteraceae bacterium]|nr:class I SAM-dependent RNA methyltransferase [Desulfobacteraceae bacterium]
MNALSKRIKRHVTGPERTFFAATSPGLEKLCLDELLSLPVSVKNTKVVEGGVEFTCRIHDCYLANLSMRIPTRILMR